MKIEIVNTLFFLPYTFRIAGLRSSSTLHGYESTTGVAGVRCGADNDADGRRRGTGGEALNWL